MEWENMPERAKALWKDSYGEVSCFKFLSHEENPESTEWRVHLSCVSAEDDVQLENCRLKKLKLRLPVSIFYWKDQCGDSGFIVEQQFTEEFVLWMKDMVMGGEGPFQWAIDAMAAKDKTPLHERLLTVIRAHMNQQYYKQAAAEVVEYEFSEEVKQQWVSFAEVFLEEAEKLEKPKAITVYDLNENGLTPIINQGGLNQHYLVFEEPDEPAIAFGPFQWINFEGDSIILRKRTVENGNQAFTLFWDGEVELGDVLYSSCSIQTEEQFADSEWAPNWKDINLYIISEEDI